MQNALRVCNNGGDDDPEKGRGSGNNRGHGGVVVGNGDPAVSQQNTEMERMCPRHN